MPPDQVRLAALINTGMWKRMTFVTICWYCLRHWNLHWRRLCRSPLSNAVQIADEVESKGCCLRCAVVGHIVRIDVQKHERNWFVTFSACAAGFVKFYYMFGYGRSGDFLYDSADLTICKDSLWEIWCLDELTTCAGTTVETVVGIIAACFPCLRPLFKTLFKDYTIGSGPTYPTPAHSGYLRSTKNNSSVNRDFEMRRRDDSKRDMSNGSEESILASARGKYHETGIVKTTQVMVDSR